MYASRGIFIAFNEAALKIPFFGVCVKLADFPPFSISSDLSAENDIKNRECSEHAFCFSFFSSTVLLAKANPF